MCLLDIIVFPLLWWLSIRVCFELSNISILVKEQNYDMISFILTLYSHLSWDHLCVLVIVIPASDLNYDNSCKCSVKFTYHTTQLFLVIVKLFFFLSCIEAPFANIFINKPNNTCHQGPGEVTLNIAEAAFIEVQQKMNKKFNTQTPKCSLGSQTKDMSLSNNSE